ncbi:polysaccharide biosynthesis/export family protein, partial [bacterium]
EMALALSGGISAKTYKGEISVIRIIDNKRILINTDNMDFKLMPKDVIDVAIKKQYYVHVLGQVQKPGVYLLPGHDKELLKIINEAGGFTDTAGLRKIEIRRMIQGRRETIYSDVRPLLKSKHQASSDIDLAPGDIVYVPQMTALKIGRETLYYFLPIFLVIIITIL